MSKRVQATVIFLLACVAITYVSTTGKQTPPPAAPVQNVAGLNTSTWTPEYTSKSPISTTTNTPSPSLPGAPASTKAAIIIEPSSTSTLQVTQTDPTIQVKALTLNVRSGPGTGYEVIATLKSGDTASITGRNSNGTWWMIQADETEGWVVNNPTYVVAMGNLKVVNVIKPPPLPTKVPVEVEPTEFVAAPPPVANTSGCPGLSLKCTQLTSCAQARACLAAGNSSLDGDHDGIPCEKLCK